MIDDFLLYGHFLFLVLGILETFLCHHWNFFLLHLHRNFFSFFTEIPPFSMQVLHFQYFFFIVNATSLSFMLLPLPLHLQWNLQYNFLSQVSRQIKVLLWLWCSETWSYNPWFTFQEELSISNDVNYFYNLSGRIKEIIRFKLVCVISFKLVSDYTSNEYWIRSRLNYRSNTPNIFKV